MAAFDVLYGRYERRLFGFIRGYLHARSDAEEVFHDAFLQVLRSREVRFETRIVRGLDLQGRAQPGAQPPAQQPAGQRRRDPVPARRAPARADEALEAGERASAVARAVAALPPGLAEVYRLRMSGMSYEEIAFTLEIPLGTVKSRTHEMVARLKTGVVTWTES